MPSTIALRDGETEEGRLTDKIEQLKSSFSKVEHPFYWLKGVSFVRVWLN